MWYSINNEQESEGTYRLPVPSAMERQTMNSNNKAINAVAYDSFRGFVAIALSLLMIPYTQQALMAQDPQPQYPAPQYPNQAPPPPPAGAYMPLGAEQLNQLVAPIALYPDSLVAQVLTASTYPQQIADAEGWMQQVAMGMPPEQRAETANTMPWDPSIKSLTAFPDVLANLARNQSWTAALGNAYYNQPGDVMNAVQAMRFRAQQAGQLRTTAQYRVVGEPGVIVIEPVNPAFVYVPYYNPWVIYGGRIDPWGGYYLAPPPRGVVFGVGLAVGFTAAIAIGAFTHYGWGYHNWAPNWHGGTVVYNHTTYISRSTTVINQGNFGGHNRGVFEQPGRGVPANFHPAVTRESFRSNAGSYRGSAYQNRPAGQASPYSRPGGAPAPQQGNQYGRPTPQGGSQYGRTAPSNQPANTYNRPAPSNPSGNTYSRPAPQTSQPNHQGPAAQRPEMTHQAPEAHQGGREQHQQHQAPARKQEERR